MSPKTPRIIRPEDEDRRTDRRPDSEAKKGGVESLPDGEVDAARDLEKSRDD
ncbi:hypothetical protein [Dongia sp. agr-C8]